MVQIMGNIGRISADELYAKLQSGEEIALVDVREEGDYGASHILFASNAPVSKLELIIGDLVPRRNALLVLCDGDGSIAPAAAEKVASFGYSNVAVLDGGTETWGKDGYEIFSGLYVPSKAFGEFIEHAYGTPSISADELKEMMDTEEDMIVLDSRPMSEYKMMNIPTGIDCPGAELAYRVSDLAPNPDTTVVVNCAGRTRSIIGAQSLINAGVPNKVVALRNGTMGWHLAGHKLEHGQFRNYEDASELSTERAKASAARVAKRFGVSFVDAATLDQWRAETDQRTLYVFDVRAEEEFKAKHIKGSRHAPGGQLVQSTDFYVGVQNARIVLVDTEQVRSIMTASWLVQLGWNDVHVLKSGLEGQETVTGAVQAEQLGADGIDAVDEISPTDASRLIEEGATVVDVDRSLSYRDGHIEGAWWVSRALLSHELVELPEGKLIFTSGDGEVAKYAARDAKSLGRDACCLMGGTAAWKRSAMPMEMGMQRVIGEPHDVYHRPYDRDDMAAVEKAMNDYLTWEIALVEQIKNKGGISFKTFPE